MPGAETPSLWAGEGLDEAAENRVVGKERSKGLAPGEMPSMNLKLATGDYSFPSLEWKQALRLARDIGVEGVDIALFAGRSHLRPADVLRAPSSAAAQISTTVRQHDLEVAGIFGQPGTVFEENAMNHPDPAVRAKATEFFYRILEFTARCNASHLTLLPGVHFPAESHWDSLKRAGEELSWRTETAKKVGVVLCVEPHIGSLVPTPDLARKLLDLVPGLTLALDYSHFTYQGISDDEIEPLLNFAAHFHARGACHGKLQASMTHNTIDFARAVRGLRKINYSGYIVLEYVWTEWMQCNQVDNLTETIRLRDLLIAAGREI